MADRARAKMAVDKYNKPSLMPMSETSMSPRMHCKRPAAQAFAALVAAALLAALPCAVRAQAMGGAGTIQSNSGLTTLDPYPPEQGWQGLSRLLDHLRPGVDTRLTPTPSQVTDRIESRINSGDLEGALKLIEWREAQLKNKPGTDVQLLFQRGRVLEALGRKDEALAVYTDMTTRFPELPEPWNNLAAIQAGQGKLEDARASLRMALRADPGYTDAQANLKLLASRYPEPIQPKEPSQQ